jgi:hypothetical protein
MSADTGDEIRERRSRTAGAGMNCIRSRVCTTKKEIIITMIINKKKKKGSNE